RHGALDGAHAPELGPGFLFPDAVAARGPARAGGRAGARFFPGQARLPAGGVDSGHAAAIFNCRLTLRLLCAPVLPGARARGRAPSVRARARLSGPAGGRAVGGSAPSAALAGAAAARGSGNRAAGTEDGTA